MFRRAGLVPLVSILCFLFIVSVPAHAAVRYVAKSGDDKNPGTSLHPWRTLAKAARTARAGDIVLVRRGTYHESLRPANSGRKDAPIVFRPYTGEHVEIDGDGVRYGIAVKNRSWIRFKGFELTNALKGFYSEGVNFRIVIDRCIAHGNRASGIHWRGMVGGRVSNNTIYENGEGIAVTESTNNVIRDNYVHDDNVDGIYCDFSTNNLFVGNRIRDHAGPNHPDGMQFWRSPGNTIAGNHVWNTRPYRDSGCQGIFLSSSPNCAITGNTVESMESFNVAIKNSPGAVVTGNHMIRSHRGGIYLSEGSTNVVITGNVLKESGEPLYVTDDSREGLVDEDNLYETP